MRRLVPHRKEELLGSVPFLRRDGVPESQVRRNRYVSKGDLLRTRALFVDFIVCKNSVHDKISDRVQTNTILQDRLTKLA